MLFSIFSGIFDRLLGLDVYHIGFTSELNVN